jgi:hypothetical protein
MACSHQIDRNPTEMISTTPRFATFLVLETERITGYGISDYEIYCGFPKTLTSIVSYVSFDVVAHEQHSLKLYSLCNRGSSFCSLAIFV